MQTEREQAIFGKNSDVEKLTSSPGELPTAKLRTLVNSRFDSVLDSKEALNSTGGSRVVVDMVIETGVVTDILNDEYAITHFVKPNEIAQVKITAAQANLDYQAIDSYHDLLSVTANRQAIADSSAVGLIRSIRRFREKAASYADFSTDFPYAVVGVFASGGNNTECFYYEKSEEFVVSHAFTSTGTSNLSISSVENSAAIDVMAIGGGGAGYNSNNHAGGGGAGELIDTTRDGGGNASIGSGDYTVYVGSGGSNNGSDTYIQTSAGSTILRADGGGEASNNTNADGQQGGCGGGAAANNNSNYQGGGTNANTGFGTSGGFATGMGGGAGQGGGGGGVGTRGISGAGPRTGSGGDGMYVGHYYPGIGDRGYVGGGGGGAPEPSDNSSNYWYDEDKTVPRIVGKPPGVGGIGGGGSGSQFPDTNNSNNSGGRNNSSTTSFEDWNVDAPGAMSQPGMDGTGGGGGGSCTGYSGNNSYGGHGQFVLRLAVPVNSLMNPPVDPRNEIAENLYTRSLPKTWDDWEELYS